MIERLSDCGVSESLGFMCESNLCNIVILCVCIRCVQYITSILYKK